MEKETNFRFFDPRNSIFFRVTSDYSSSILVPIRPTFNFDYNQWRTRFLRWKHFIKFWRRANYKMKNLARHTVYEKFKIYKHPQRSVVRFMYCNSSKKMSSSNQPQNIKFCCKFSLQSFRKANIFNSYMKSL